MGQSRSKDKIDGKKSRHVAFEIADDKQNVQTLTVDEKLLSSESSVFKRMAKSGVLKKKKVVRLNNISLLGLQRILGFLETGEIAFENCKEAQETLAAALEYGMENVKEASLDYLVTKMKPSDVFEIYEFAETHHLAELEHECLRIIDKETHVVIESAGFMKLKLSTLVSITKRGNLNLRSEFSLLKAVIDWGKREMSRRGVDTGQTQVFMDIITPVLDNLRCRAMSNRKHYDPLLIEVFKYILGKRYQSTVEQSIQRSIPRHYRDYYVHEMDIVEFLQSTLSPGDHFNLKVEVLKGRVFFYGVCLALKVLSSISASAACLHAVLTATNTNTADKKVVRHTFFNVNNDSHLKFKSPLIIKESESFILELIVQITGKVMPLARKNEVEIFFSDDRDVAMKIFAQRSSQKFVKCPFKKLLYYF